MCVSNPPASITHDGQDLETYNYASHPPAPTTHDGQVLETYIKI